MRARQKNAANYLNCSIARDRKGMYTQRFETFVIVAYRSERLDTIKDSLEGFLTAAGTSNEERKRIIDGLKSPGK